MHIWCPNCLVLGCIHLVEALELKLDEKPLILHVVGLAVAQWNLFLKVRGSGTRSPIYRSPHRNTYRFPHSLIIDVFFSEHCIGSHHDSGYLAPAGRLPNSLTLRGNVSH